jgi:hypothetical protein
MSTERRENAHCNEHKFVSRDSQFHCCFWYAVVLQDVARQLWAMSIELRKGRQDVLTF